MIYRNIIVFVYLISAGVLVSILKGISLKFGVSLQLFANSIIYSFYCFDFKIAAIGLSTEQSILFFESNWSYYSGFGFVFTVSIYFLPFLLNSGLFSLLFPILICLSVDSEPLIF